MDNDYTDKSNGHKGDWPRNQQHQKNQFSFFEEKISPKTYEEYEEESENNFHQTVENVFAYNTANDIRNQKLMIEEKQGLSKSVSVDRVNTISSPTKKLSNSDRRVNALDDEDQPSLQSPAPRPQNLRQMEKSADFRDFASIINDKKEGSEDRYKVQHVLKGLKHQQSCRPASCYLASNNKSARKETSNQRYEFQNWEEQPQEINQQSEQKPIKKQIIEFGENHFEDNKTPIKDIEIQRSKSHNAQYGCLQVSDIQAHLDNMRQKQLAHSPFQNLREQNPHFESLYQIRCQQQLSSPFADLAELPMTPSSFLELTQTNPLAQSMNLNRQSIVSSSMRQMLSSSMQGLPGSGHQYEVLLNERQSLQGQIQELQKINEENKKTINQLKTQLSLQKIELNEKDEDLEEAKSCLAQKVNDQKETIERLTKIIEEQGTKLIDSHGKERQSNTSLEQLKKKNADLQSQFENLKLEYETTKKQISNDETKVKEIYALTVELGCLREENNELNKNIQTQKVDFEERLNDQRSRANEEYDKLQEEMQIIKVEKEQEINEAKAEIEKLMLEIQQLKEAKPELVDQKTSIQLEFQIQEKLETIKSEKSSPRQLEVEEPVNYPPLHTKVICSPEFEDNISAKYLKETSVFGGVGKGLTEDSILLGSQSQQRIIPMSPPMQTDFAESFEEEKKQQYSPIRHSQAGLQRCQSDFGMRKLNNNLNKSATENVRASQEIQQRPSNAQKNVKHNFKGGPSLASNLIAQRKKTATAKNTSQIMSQSFVSQRSSVLKNSAQRISKVKNDTIPTQQKLESTLRMQKSPNIGSQTHRGHIESNRALIDSSNRITTPRKDPVPIASSRLTSRQTIGKASPNYTLGKVSPKPQLSSRISYNPPIKAKKENEAAAQDPNEMKQKLQSIQTGKAYLEKKIQEYESRLTQMKNKKEKSRACLIGGPPSDVKVGTDGHNRISSRSQLF